MKRLLLILLYFFTNASWAIDELQLTPAEKQWLEEHPKIFVGTMEAWPPMDFVDLNGVPQGIGADFVRAINKRFENRLHIVPDSWDVIYKMVKNQKMDALMGITPRKDREPFFNFTKPYAVVPHVIISRKNGSYHTSLDDLAKKTIAVEKGFFIAGYLREHYPQAVVQEYRNTSDALDAVFRKQADAYIGNRAVANYIMIKELMSDLQIQGKIYVTSSTNSIGVRKDYPQLRSILDKLLALIPPEEINQIYRKWGSVSKDDQLSVNWINLKPEEKKWIAEHPVIKVASDSEWYPVEFIDKQGERQGIVTDYLKLISKKLGLKFKYGSPDAWKKQIQKVKDHKLDVVAAMDITDERKKFVSFTSPYLVMPLVIFTRNDVQFVESLKSIGDKTIAVVSGYSEIEKIKRDYPEIKMIKTDSMQEALSLLVSGKVFAYIGTIMNTGHYIHEAGYTNLNVSGETEYSYRIAIAYRKDWPILGSVLQKALDSISELERNKIKKKWVTITVHKKVDKSLIWKIGLGSIAAFLVFLFWNRRLAAEITKRKFLQKELIKAKLAAEEATKAKSSFLANMSHEIRTPMNAIICMGHLVMKTEMTDKQRDYIKKIQFSADNLLGIINDILDFSKIEAGKLEIETTDFNLDRLLDQVSTMITAKASEKNVELVFAASPSVSKFLRGDPLRLEQIFLNLISNAIRFTDAGGEVVVKIKELERKEQEALLLFSVQDNGIGISEEQQSRLFQSFQQADSSTTRKYGGTGLGLTICKKLVEMMNGEIWVVSEYGKGTSFFFALPFEKRERKQKRLELSVQQLRDTRILVVDDNQASRETLQSYLTDFSFDVDVAANGVEAVEMVKHTFENGDRPYSLIMMDWLMPEMDGIEASRRILQNCSKGRAPKIIMVTSHGREDVMNQLDALTLHGHLLKPVTQSTLFDTVMEILSEDLGIRYEQTSFDEDSECDTEFELKGVKVLLVEDNEINQQVAREIMEGAEINVTIVENGKLAIQELKSSENGKYDIVLMDLQMPEIDGYTACRMLRRNPRFKRLPIVAMTADAMAGVKEAVLQAGMNDYITKPIDPPKLMETIAKWTNRHAKVDLNKVISHRTNFSQDLYGISVTDGLNRVGGNKDLYFKLLYQFYENYHEAGNQIEKAIQSRDSDTTERLAHSIKGVAANLGAKELGVIADTICKTVKHDDFVMVEKHYHAFSREFEEIMKSLRSYYKV